MTITIKKVTGWMYNGKLYTTEAEATRQSAHDNLTRIASEILLKWLLTHDDMQRSEQMYALKASFVELVIIHGGWALVNTLSTLLRDGHVPDETKRDQTEKP